MPTSVHAHLGEPNAEWVTELAKLPNRDTDAMLKLSIVEQRGIINGILQTMRAANPLVLDPAEVQKTTHQIPVGEGAEIHAAAYLPVPKTAKGETEATTHPLMVYFHGGGFAFMDHEIEEERLTNLAIKCRISILNVEYRKAPEHPFPIGLNDAYAAVKWGVANSKSKLGADVSKGLIVGGASSGANFAAAISLMARDDVSFPAKITGQLLQIPPVLHPHLRGKFPEIISPEEQANEAQLTKESIQKIFENYLPDPTTDLADPRISPLLAPSHTGLPPAFFQICGMDPLRDEGFVYERVLREAGVPTKVAVYPGVPHAFHFMVPTHSLAKQWIVDLESSIAWFAAQLAR